LRQCVVAHGLLPNHTVLDRCALGPAASWKLYYQQTSQRIKTWMALPYYYINDATPLPAMHVRSAADLINSVCLKLKMANQASTFPWWVFGFMLVLAGVVFLLFWSVRGGRSQIGRVICGLFFELPSEAAAKENLAERALRRWRDGERVDSTESDEAPLDLAPGVGTSNADEAIRIESVAASTVPTPISSPTMAAEAADPSRRPLFTIQDDSDDSGSERGHHEALRRALMRAKKPL